MSVTLIAGIHGSEDTSMKTLLVAVSMIPALLFGACDTKTKPVGSCGDGILDPGELCDGSQLSASSCAELGYYEQTGTLRCNAGCSFDLSVCAGGRCGDGTLQSDHGEACDGANLDRQTCVTLGFSQGSGALGCTEACRFDESACVPKASNAELATLTVGGVPLVPAFSTGTTSYTATVPVLVTEVTVTATATDPYATVEITPAQPMALTPGANAVTVTVTAGTGTRRCTRWLSRERPRRTSSHRTSGRSSTCLPAPSSGI
jgi:hypothetical protein